MDDLPKPFVVAELMQGAELLEHHAKKWTPLFGKNMMQNK
jgi:hypothetical protein